MALRRRFCPVFKKYAPRGTARFAKPLQGPFSPVAKHPQKHKNRPEIGRFSHFNPSAEMHPFSLFSASKAPEKWLCDAICRKKQLFAGSFGSRSHSSCSFTPAALKDVNKPIENIVSAIEQGIIIPATKQRLDDLEEQRKALETNILQEQIAKPLLTREQILFRFERFRQGDPSVSAYQRNIIDCFVNSVYIFDDRFVVNFNYRDGDKLVSLQEVKSSSLAEYGLPFEPSFSDGSFFDGKRQYRFFHAV